MSRRDPHSEKRIEDMRNILSVLSHGPEKGMTINGIQKELEGKGIDLKKARIRKVCEEMSWERYNLVRIDKSKNVTLYRPTEFKTGQMPLEI